MFFFFVLVHVKAFYEAMLNAFGKTDGQKKISITTQPNQKSMEIILSNFKSENLIKLIVIQR